MHPQSGSVVGESDHFFANTKKALAQRSQGFFSYEERVYGAFFVITTVPRNL